MSKFHHIREEDIHYGILKGKNYRDGVYLVYQKDMYNRILLDKQWVYDNDAYDEYEWLCDQGGNTLKDYEDKLRYVPNAITALKIEVHDMYHLECNDLPM